MTPTYSDDILTREQNFFDHEAAGLVNEDQLVYRDFEPLQQYFSDLKFHHFYCLERLHRILGSAVRRRLRSLDHRVQRLLRLVDNHRKNASSFPLHEARGGRTSRRAHGTPINGTLIGGGPPATR